MSFHNEIDSMNLHLVINSPSQTTSSCGYPFYYYPRHPPSAHQGHIQGSPGLLGWGKSTINPIHIWIGFLMISTASMSFFSICFFALMMWYVRTIGLQQLHHFQSCVIFLKAAALNSGLAMIQKLLWRYMWIHFKFLKDCDWLMARYIFLQLKVTYPMRSCIHFMLF